MTASPASGDPVFVDTSGWFAFLNEADDANVEAVRAVGELDRKPVTSQYVFDELVTLVGRRRGHPAAVAAGNLLLDGTAVDLVHVTRADEEAAWHRFQAREDKRYSFTDCTSFVVMERLGIQHVLATDEDFQKEGFTDVLVGQR